MTDSSHAQRPLTRRDFAKLMGAATAGLALPACGRGSEVGPDGMPLDGPYDVALRDGLMVSMRDGIRLATDVYLPARSGEELPGPWPVILERTPYGRNRPSRSERSVAEPDEAKSRAEVARVFVERGYAVVYQDVRGRYDSEGEYQKYLDDAPDGYDCCAWIVAQEWCDGRIGTKGLSYAAHTQAALASAGAPGVAAMFLDSGGFSNSYQGGIRQGGTFELKQATWAYRNALVSPEVAGDPEVKAAMEAVDVHRWFREMPWRPGRSPVSLAPAYEAYLFEQWTHGVFDDYWKQPGIYALGYHDVWPDAPMVHMSSWYDPYRRGELHGVVGAQERSGSAHPWSVDPRRSLADLRGRRGLRSGCDPGWPARLRLLGASGALVRPLAPWGGQRRRPGAHGAVLRDGRRIGKEERRRPSGPRRALAFGHRLAHPRSSGHAVLPDVRRRAGHRKDHGAGGRPLLPVRPLRPRAESRRHHHLGCANNGGRRVRQEGERGIVG